MDFDIVRSFVDALRSALGTSAVMFALAGVGLNVMFGFTGLLNFGHVGSLLVGGYGTAITVNLGGSLWLGVLVGIAAAVILGLIYGLPTLRLREDYLAIVTIAAAEILRLLARSSALEPLTQGVFGIQKFADEFYALNPFPRGSYGIWRITWDANTLWAIVIGWLAVALSVWLVWALTRAPWGRVLKAIREDEDAARALGKNVFGYKLQSLAIGGAIGSLAGIFFAVQTQSVNPDSFQPIFTFLAYAVVILGGPGRVMGPVLGSILFWFLLSFTEAVLRQAVTAGFIPDWLLTAQEVAAVRWILVGLGLMLLMTFRPQGLFGSREETLIDAR